MAAYNMITTLITAALIAIAASEDICDKADFTNGVGYVANPRNCHEYVMCWKLRESGYGVYALPCPSNLYWRQDMQKCYVKSDGLHPCSPCHKVVQTHLVCPKVLPTSPPAHEPTSQPAHEPTSQQAHDSTLTVSLCERAAVPGFPKLYYVKGETLSCPEDTVFEGCMCQLQRNNTEGNCGEDPMLRYPLTGNLTSTQCLGEPATPYNNPNTTDYLCLDGQTQRVEIDWLMGNYTETFTISLWFLPHSMSYDDMSYMNTSYTNTSFSNETMSFPFFRQGLVGNGGCNTGASWQIYLEDGTVMGKVVTTEGSANFSNVCQLRKYNIDEWNHVAMVYTGWSLEMWLNGQFAGARGGISGGVAETQLATTLGLTYTGCQPNFFKGCMCDFRVYKRGVFMMEMGEIYSKGACAAST